MIAYKINICKNSGKNKEATFSTNTKKASDLLQQMINVRSYIYLVKRSILLWNEVFHIEKDYSTILDILVTGQSSRRSTKGSSIDRGIYFSARSENEAR